MIQPFVLWPSVCGALFLVAGLALVGRAWSAASGLEKLIALGPVFVAAPLATFGAEHFVQAQSMREIVPAWMPVRLFWVYFVGVALFAAATSLVARRQLRLSTTLLGVMFFLFVVMVHVPGALVNPGNRFPWTVVLRETAFAGGALAFAAAQTAPSADARRAGSSPLVTLGRAMVVVPLLFFAFEHFLHPEGALGLPLRKATPLWFPGRLVLGYSTGVVLLVLAGATLVERYARTAAACLGLLFLALTVFVYVPILIASSGPSALLEGLNYVFDTLLCSGTMLFLSSALPPSSVPQRYP